MRRFCIAVLLCLGSCQKGHVMSGNDYAQIEMGMSLKQLEKEYGLPVATHMKNGKEIYEYSQRYYMNEKVVVQKRFFFVIEDGKVTRKYTTTDNRPAFELIEAIDFTQ